MLRQHIVNNPLLVIGTRGVKGMPCLLREFSCIEISSTGSVSDFLDPSFQLTQPEFTINEKGPHRFRNLEAEERLPLGYTLSQFQAKKYLPGLRWGGQKRGGPPMKEWINDGLRLHSIAVTVVVILPYVSPVFNKKCTTSAPLWFVPPSNS